MGGRESAETVRKRQLLWREQNPKSWRRLRAKQKLRYYQQFQKNTRCKGRRWSAVEDARITAKDRPADRKISKSLGRSVQAIQQRRYLLSRGWRSSETGKVYSYESGTHEDPSINGPCPSINPAAFRLPSRPATLTPPESLR